MSRSPDGQTMTDQPELGASSLVSSAGPITIDVVMRGLASSWMGLLTIRWRTAQRSNFSRDPLSLQSLPYASGSSFVVARWTANGSRGLGIERQGPRRSGAAFRLQPGVCEAPGVEQLTTPRDPRAADRPRGHPEHPRGARGASHHANGETVVPKKPSDGFRIVR